MCAKRLRDIIMSLMIFLLEHIVIYIEWKKDREFYVQRQGLPTGGSFSDAIAILCMWLCEKELLKSFGALVLCIRGNGIIHRAHKAIPGDECRPRRSSWLRFPWITPILNSFKLRGL
jgi:hypothetical protein